MLGHGGFERPGRRGVLLAVGVLGVLLAGSAVFAVPHVRDREQRQLAHRTERELTRTAQRVRTDLLAGGGRTGPELRRVAGQMEGTQVLAVTGADRTGPGGVRLVFRIRTTKTAASVFGYQRARAVGCFAQVVDDRAGSAPLERLPCPAAEPPAPVLPPDAEARLRAALIAARSGSAVDEARVRAAVADLGLHSRVRVDVRAGIGVVGVGLRDGDTCLMGRLTAEEIRVWRATGAEVRPGEPPCTGTQATDGPVPSPTR